MFSLDRSSVFSSAIYNFLSSSGVDPILFWWTIIYFNMFLFLGKYLFVSFLFYHFSILLAFSFGEHYCFLLSFCISKLSWVIICKFLESFSCILCSSHQKEISFWLSWWEKKNFLYHFFGNSGWNFIIKACSLTNEHQDRIGYIVLPFSGQFIRVDNYNLKNFISNLGAF